MSFFDRIGDAAEGLGEGLRDGVGLAFDVAKAVVPGDSYGWSDFSKDFAAHKQGAMSAIPNAVELATQATLGPIGDVPGVNSLIHSNQAKGLSAISWLYHNAGQAGGNGLQAVGDVLSHGYVSSDDLDKMKSRKLNYGDALTATGAQVGTLGRSKLNYDNVRSYTKTGGDNFNLFAMFSSGVSNGVAGWYAGPDVLAGKAVMGAREASRVVKPGDLAAIKEGTTSGLRQKAVENRFNGLVTFTRGKTSGELMRTSFLKDNEQGDTIATLIGDVNKQFGKVLAHPEVDDATAAKALADRDTSVASIIRAGLGDKPTLDRLAAENDLVSHRIQNLTEQVDWMDEVGARATTPAARKAAIEAKTAQVKDELKVRRDYQDILDKIQGAHLADGSMDPNQPGIFGKLGDRLPEYGGAADQRALNQLNMVHRSTKTGIRRFVSQDGISSTPVQVLDFIRGARPNGVVDLSDGLDVNSQFGLVLERVRGLEGSHKNELASMVANANNDAARQIALDIADTKLVAHIAKQALGPEADAKTIQSIVTDFRASQKSAQQAIWGSKGEAAYGPEIDKATGMRVDQFLSNDGEWMTNPLVSSQLANSRALLDPDEIYRAISRNKHQILAHAMHGVDVMEALGKTGIKIWKFGKLARLGYPMRSVADAQIRMMITLGGLDYIHMATTGAKNTVLSHTERVDQTLLMGVEARGDYLKQIEKIDEKIAKLNEPLSARVQGKAIGGHTRARKAGISKLEAEKASLQAQIDEPLVGTTVSSKLDKAERPRMGFGEYKVGPYTVPDFHGRTVEELERSIKKISAGETFAAQMGVSIETLRKQLRASGTGTVFKGGDAEHTDKWLIAANHQLKQDPMIQYLLENGTKKTVGWLKGNPAGRAVARRMRPIYHDDYEEMARKGDELIDMVVGGRADLRDTLRQRSLSEADLKAAWPNPADRPPIHGETIEHTLHKGLAAETFDNIIRGFYKWTSDIPEGKLARHPLAVQFYRRHVKNLIATAEHGSDELLGADDLERIRSAAVSLARRDMKRTLYNIASTPNLSSGIWKYVFPFFGAFEDVAVKYGHLAFEDPSRVARANLVWNAPNKAGIAVDNQGNVVGPGKGISDSEFILVPAVLTRHLPLVGDLIKWRVSKSSANVVLQGDPWFLPGFGPVLGLAANEISKRQPQTEAVLEKLGFLPFGTATSSKDQINPLPTWSNRLWSAFHNTHEHQQVYAEILAAEHMAINDGKRKDPGREKLLDEVGHKTTAWFVARAAANFGLPVSAGPMTKYQFYFDEAHRYQDPTKNHDLLNRVINGQKVTLTPEEAFYTDYPKYFEAMGSLSSNNTGIKSTLEGVNARKRWSKEVDQFPEYGSLFVGPTDEGTYSGAARAWQLSHRLRPGSNETDRSFKDPREAMAKNNAEKGWIQFRKVSDQIEAIRIQRGLKSLNSKGGEDLQQIKQEVTQHLMSINKDWRDDYLSRDAGKMTRFFEAAHLAVTSPKAKGRDDLDALRQYMQVRGQLQKVLQQRKAAGGSGKLDLQNPGQGPNGDIESVMDEYVSHLKERYLAFGDLYDRNLSGDDLSAPQP